LFYLYPLFELLSEEYGYNFIYVYEDTDPSVIINVFAFERREDEYIYTDEDVIVIGHGSRNGIICSENGCKLDSRAAKTIANSRVRAFLDDPEGYLEIAGDRVLLILSCTGHYRVEMLEKSALEELPKEYLGTFRYPFDVVYFESTIPVDDYLFYRFLTLFKSSPPRHLKMSATTGPGRREDPTVYLRNLRARLLPLFESLVLRNAAPRRAYKLYITRF